MAVDTRNLYEVLQVSQTASSEVIAAAYRELARQYHPDTNPADENATLLFKRITLAFEILSDPQKREKYDRRLARQEQARTEAAQRAESPPSTSRGQSVSAPPVAPEQRLNQRWWGAASLVVLLIFVIISACYFLVTYQSPDDLVQEYLEQANAALEQKDFVKAQEFIREAEKVDGAHNGLQIEKARERLEEKQVAHAEATKQSDSIAKLSEEHAKQQNKLLGERDAELKRLDTQIRSASNNLKAINNQIQEKERESLVLADQLTEQAAKLEQQTQSSAAQTAKIQQQQETLDLQNELLSKKIAELKALQQEIDDAGSKVAAKNEKKSEPESKKLSARIKIPKDAIAWQGHHYKIYDEGLTHAVAQKRCESMGGHLARINNRDEQKFVAKAIFSHSKDFFSRHPLKDEYWLDGSDADEEGFWKFSDGSRMKYFAWKSGEPNNGDELEHQIMIKKNTGVWFDAGTERQTGGFICEWDSGSQASIARVKKKSQAPAEPEDDTVERTARKKIPRKAAKWGENYYLVSNKKVSHAEAKNRCELGGGHLVRIDSAAEQEFIARLASAGALNIYWIDGSDEVREGRWLFSNGKPMFYKFWDSNPKQPSNTNGNEHHIEIRRDQKWTWNDIPDYREHGFICEWDSEGEEEASSTTSK